MKEYVERKVILDAIEEAFAKADPVSDEQVGYIESYRIVRDAPTVYCDIPEGGELTINGYQRDALRTAAGPKKDLPLILNGVLGLGGESGECLDIVKKHLFQGHELDTEHLAKELGDVAWYLAVSAFAIGMDLESILRMNVEKLRDRYPDGFEVERSVSRKEGDK